jgi:hypothetical protein
VRTYAQFSAVAGREICRRLAAGETQAEICADPAMPCLATLWRWTRRHAAFARAYARARALGGRAANGKAVGLDELAANEIVARVSEGEMLTEICADPHLPSVRTVVRWRDRHPEFAEELRLAREGLAERLSDLGWKMAMEATPETAYLTRVRLGQLRWTTAVLGPRTHGRLKPAAPPEPPEVDTYLFRHFVIEENTETGQHRVVVFTPDSKTNLPVRTSEGEWKDPIDPEAKARGLRVQPPEPWPPVNRPAGPPPDDPEGWC